MHSNNPDFARDLQALLLVGNVLLPSLHENDWKNIPSIETKDVIQHQFNETKKRQQKPCDTRAKHTPKPFHPKVSNLTQRNSGKR